MSDDFKLENLSLGQQTEYQSDYDPKLLQAIPRSLNRKELGCVEQQPFSGVDVWHAYEMSWLNSKGKPVVAIGRFTFQASSPQLIESKSFKLYLNSFNQRRCDSREQVVAMLRDDLASVSGGGVEVELIAPDDLPPLLSSALPGDCIDGLDISVDSYSLSPDTLATIDSDQVVSETLHSHLLKSNCLITNT